MSEEFEHTPSLTGWYTIGPILTYFGRFFVMCSILMTLTTLIMGGLDHNFAFMKHELWVFVPAFILGVGFLIVGRTIRRKADVSYNQALRGIHIVSNGKDYHGSL